MQTAGMQLLLNLDESVYVIDEDEMTGWARHAFAPQLLFQQDYTERREERRESKRHDMCLCYAVLLSVCVCRDET